MARVSFLLNDLLMRSQWVTIEEYADLLYVSARTLSNDMRLVEQKLAQFDLTLEKRPRYGIRVAGGESQRRLCLASLVRPCCPTPTMQSSPSACGPSPHVWTMP